MKKVTVSFDSSNGVDTVVGYFYAPDEGEPRAVVQLSHGMCEYVERYERFAAALTAQGFALCGNDHIGHGRSVKDVDGLGYLAKKQGWRHAVRDLYTFTGLIRARYPAQPLFLLGHSMGSFLARAYLNEGGGELTGAILSGTAGKNPLSGPGKAVVALLTLFHGGHYRSAFVKKLSFGGYNDRCEEHRTDTDWLTRDTEIVDRYNADPLCNFTFTLAGYRDLMGVLSYVNSRKGTAHLRADLPVLFVAGAMDPVGNYGKGVAESAERFRAAGVRDVAVRLYENDRHELLNERDYEQVTADLVDWMEGVISPTGTK